MSLHPHPVPAVPEETARVAHAAFPRDNVYLRMRDAFGATLLLDSRVVDLPMSSNPIGATLSSLKPFFFNDLQ